MIRTVITQRTHELLAGSVVRMHRTASSLCIIHCASTSFHTSMLLLTELSGLRFADVVHNPVHLMVLARTFISESVY